MSSTTMNFVGEKTSSQQVFSYAQAAKGRPSATAFAIQINQSATPSSTASTKDMNSIVSTPSQSSVREDQSATESIETLSRLEISTETIALDLKTMRSEPSDSPPSTPVFLSTSLSSPLKENEKEDDYVSVGSTSGPVREQNSTGKKGKRQKNTSDETDREEVKPEVLVPAPLPAVNFWQQRKEKLAKSISPQTTKNSKPLSDTVNSVDGLSLDIKNTEPKKRGKQLGIDTSERNTPSNQNGPKREPVIASRTPKKTSNGPSKFKEEQSNKKNGTRGSRLTEKDEKSFTSQVPPPVEDASSWPTPETVLIEDKRKVQEKQERDERDDNTSNKPRHKEKWVPVPYIPTVTFNTPMPTRGGRARGSGRPGRIEHETRSNHGQNGALSTEKIYTVTSESTNSGSEVDRPNARENSTSNSAPSIRRQSGDPPNSNSRKLSIAQLAEKTRSNHPKSENQYQNESYHFSRNGQPVQNVVENRDSKTHNAEQLSSLKITQIQANEVAGIGLADRRNDSNIRNSDHSHINRENNHNSRERVEGRSERSRGGFRGRGSHSNYSNGHSHHSNYSNGASSHHQNGYNVRQAPYSPPLVPPYNNQFVPPPRASRVGPRSQSIPSNGSYGRFSQNSGSVSQTLPSLQTSTPMYDYTPIQPMSAPPYQPYIDQISVFAMVTMQLEYYFSIDNLCKDVYLRKHMDSQGFVYLSFIAGFKRIVALTQDFELIRFACQESEVIELVRGEDGIDRLRRKEGWEKWVLTVEEREDSSKSPSFWNPSQYTQKLQHVGQIIMTSPHPTCVMSYSMSESGFPPYSKDGSVVPCLNKNEVYQPPTPLSAAVPDFAPGLPPIDITNDLLEAENTFHEDEVVNLTLVFASPDASNGDVQPLTPFYHTSQRTFSNGSLDRRLITEETQDDSHSDEKSFVNGFQKPENPFEVRSRSTSPHSPTRSDLSNGPPVMWVKGQRQQVPISDRNSQELYVNFRTRALRNREISLSTTTETHPDMKLLYEFWSHFLCRNFNSQMYLEFRRYALEDARTGSFNGMINLINYYDEALNSKKKVIPEVLARHFLDLVKLETSDERPAFERLRAAWRNGALDLKSRKRIDSLLNPRLKQELEQAPHQKSDLK